MVDTSDSPSLAAPRWHRRPEDRPEEILDAAVEVFGVHGFARAKLEDVAKHAGVSKGTLYLYFKSKDELFREMVRTRIVPVVQEGEAEVETWTGTARALLKSTISRYWQVLGNDRTSCMARLVKAELRQFPELGRFYFDEVIMRSRRLITTVLQFGISNGEFRRASLPMAPRLIPAMLVQLAESRPLYAAFDADTPTDEQFIDGILDFVLNGVANATSESA